MLIPWSAMSRIHYLVAVLALAGCGGKAASATCAPVADLEKVLGVKAEISADKKTVTVKGKAVASTAREARNIHLHDEFVYAPIKEFAEAAGFRVDVDGTKHIVNIRK